MSSSGGQLNLSCGFTPSAAYARHAAPAAAPRARAASPYADSYTRHHDQPARPAAVSYADVLRQQRLVR